MIGLLIGILAVLLYCAVQLRGIRVNQVAQAMQNQTQRTQMLNAFTREIRKLK